MKNMFEFGGCQRLEGDKTQSAGAYLEIRTELQCSVQCRGRLSREVVTMTDGSSISLAVAGTPVEPKPECWRAWLIPSRD